MKKLLFKNNPDELCKEEIEFLLSFIEQEIAKLNKSVKYMDDHDLISRACTKGYKKHLVHTRKRDLASIDILTEVRKKLERQAGGWYEKTTSTK